MVAAVTMSVVGPAAGQTKTATAPAEPQAPSAEPQTGPTNHASAAGNAADALVARLSDPDWRRRDKARAELVRLGEAAVPALDRVTRSAPTDEARTAAAAALKQIADDRVVGASYVTLKLTDAPARRAFEELGRQAFAPLRPYPDDLWAGDMAQAKVTVDVDRQPFWAAMRELGRQTGLEVREFNGEQRLMHAGGNPNGQLGGRAVVAGAFLVTANQLTRSQTIDLSADGDPPVQDDFGIQLTAAAEPKVRVLAVAPAVRLEAATDDHGNSLLPPAPPPDAADNLAGPAFGGEGSYSLYAALKYPAANPGKRIARLRGSATFTVQVESEKLDVPVAKLPATSRTIKDVRIAFGPMAKTGDGWQVKLTAHTPEDAPAWQEIQANMIARLKVVDAAGQPLDNQGFGSGGGGDKVELTLTFGQSHRPEDGRQSGDPVRLVWEIPTRTRDVTVPFEFKDLKLP